MIPCVFWKAKIKFYSLPHIAQYCISHKQVHRIRPTRTAFAPIMLCMPKYILELACGIDGFP